MGAGPSIEHACAESLPRDVLKIIAAKYSERYYYDPDYEWVKNTDYKEKYEYRSRYEYIYPSINNYIIAYSYLKNVNHFQSYVEINKYSYFYPPITVLFKYNIGIILNIISDFKYKDEFEDVDKINSNHLIGRLNKYRYRKIWHRLIKIAIMIIFKHLNTKMEFKKFINLPLKEYDVPAMELEPYIFFYKNCKTVKDLLDLKL